MVRRKDSEGSGGLFGGIEAFIRLIGDFAEKGGVKETGEITGLPKGAKGVYGLSIRTIVGGQPVVETFGNLRPSPDGPVVNEVREPITDVFDEKDRVMVIVEIPGAAEEKTKVEIDGDIMNITASDGERRYSKEILLPAKVNPDSLKTSYRNGILEISVDKKGE